MIVVRIFTNYESKPPLKHIMELWEKAIECPEYGKKIRFTERDDYTHAIIVNTAMPHLHVPKSRVIGFTWEPAPFIKLTAPFRDYARRHIGKYYLVQGFPIRQLGRPFQKGYTFMHHSVARLPKNPKKDKGMSIIFSAKRTTTNHKYRHALVEAILRSKLPIDVYGRGCRSLPAHLRYDSRVKGGFPMNSDKPYSDYVYSIAIENVSVAGYISEKYKNCIVCNTVPVYLGCTNIEAYFPGCQIKLERNLIQDMLTLHRLLQRPPGRFPLDRAREKHFGEYSLVRHCLNMWS